LTTYLGSPPEGIEEVNNMIIGLISDTHDNIYMIDRAVERFNSESVELVLHAGDYIAPFIAKHFEALKAPMIGVFGNNCAETETLSEVYGKIGVKLKSYFEEIDSSGLSIALLHGHRRQDLNRINQKEYDVVVWGHTHRPSISKKRNTLIVNPGEACGYITGTATIAFLDTDKVFAWLSRLD
jgi:hypothetical protein